MERICNTLGRIGYRGPAGVVGFCRNNEFYMIMMRVTRQTLRSQDFPENPQKTLFATFSDAAKKPSKTLKKLPAAPGNFEKPSKNPPAAP